MTKQKKYEQIILRTTKEEKEIIKYKANKANISVNEFIKQCIFNGSKHNKNIDNNDINKDITLDILEVLKEQLTIKDEQIKNLQTIIYNKDNKDNKVLELVEYTKSKKYWWKFWKKEK